MLIDDAMIIKIIIQRWVTYKRYNDDDNNI